MDFGSPVTPQAPQGVAACTNCHGPLAAEQLYCPQCGRAAAGVSYRGPAVIAAIATFFLVVGGGVALASWGSIQSQGASGIAADIAGPLVNDLLGGIGSEQIDLISGGGGGASWTVVIAFLAGSLLAFAACFFLLGALIWFLVRWAPRNRAKDAYVRAQPSLDRAREQAAPAARQAAQRSATVAREEIAPRVADGARKSRDAAQKALEKRRARKAGQ